MSCWLSSLFEMLLGIFHKMICNLEQKEMFDLQDHIF